ncbi:MAG: PDZ domain-containing protein [Alistipes sp.]|nr:PDZ domain-containing protein [Alistipes sp.]
MHKHLHKSVLILFATLSLLPLRAQRTADAVQIQKLLAVYRKLAELYVEEVDVAPLTEKAIRSMLEELDPHSVYINAEEMQGVAASFEGEFSGIGIEFSILRDTIHVVNTIAGGPAEQAGIRPNDRIVRVDTVDAIGFRTIDVPKHLRGQTGSRVELDIVRPDMPNKLHFVVIRNKIPLNTVDAAYLPTDSIGYIKINRFGRTTLSEFRTEYEKLGNPNKLVLDLRGNGGGLLEQAIGLAGFFLSQNATIVSTEGRAVPPMTFRAEEDGEARDARLVVLIDESSASASEIVAGAIQDWDRGVILGRPSFGKGLVQRQIELGDGSAVRITVARYHTPSGRVIQRPYKKGNRREYYQNHKRRRNNTIKDSIDTRTPVYRTLRTGRVVYGGGGIKPDILIANDTTEFTNYHAELIRRGVVNEYVMTLLDLERNRMERLYPSFEIFDRKFTVTDAQLDKLAALGDRHAIQRDSEAMDAAATLLRIQLKALIAQRLFGSEYFYRIINREHDVLFGKALELLKNWEQQGAPLLENHI